MIQINLIPAKVRKTRDTTRQFFTVYISSIFLVVLGVGYLWYSMNSERASLEGQISKLDRQIQQYAKYDRMLRDLTQKTEVIDKKTSIIQSLQKDRDTMVRVLAALSVELPADKMWFERLHQSGNAVTLDGTALNNESIVEFMRNLESSPMVEAGSVHLTHSRRVRVNDSNLREFRISYRFFSFSQMQAKLEKKTP